MRLPFSLQLALLASVSALSPVKRHYSTHNYYVLEHDPSSGTTLVDAVQLLGLEVVERAGELQNHWLARVAKPSSHLAGRDNTDHVVDALQNLRHRATINDDARQIVSSVKHLFPQTLRQRSKRAPPPPPGPADNSSTRARLTAQQLGIDDPMFPRQWHLINDMFPEHMMNPTPVWDMGITGRGIISAMVDDGLDYRSRDLADNFDSAGSYDFNDHVGLPTPVLFDDHHGTRCAGQIAAVKNDVCGVGIAYDSKVAGIRILSGPISDVDEAAALNYGYQNTSIYSCSWGPPDDGMSMEGPGYLIKKAVVNGIENGRQGKGSIYVFASGNGAAHGDQCNFDGYTNSIYSVTVAAVDFKGLHPYYSESCAANMIVAYSSGSGEHIVTTDIEGKCATTHGGTSAAAPNAAGVFALALEARPELSWRDIQHLCVQTAQMINPDDPDWETIASGRRFSYKYGFGVLNALEYVKAAQSWQLVKPQAWMEIDAIQLNNGSMNVANEMSGGEVIVSGGIKSTTTITQAMLDAYNLESLEHITIKVWISHTKRGDVEVDIVSPNNIRSVLAAPRHQDADSGGYPGWQFMSVKHWGENPVGNWTIRVSDQSFEGQSGKFHGWSMMLWGSTIDASRARKYELPFLDTLLPPLASSHDGPVLTPTSTKSHPKPTAHLPGDHGTAEGDNHRPAFPGGADAAETANPSSSTPTPDEGWFPDMSSLISGKKWFFGAVGAVAVFGIAAGVFFWRRRTRRRRIGTSYSTLAGDDVAMSSIGRDGRSRAGGGTKELYDAFGEISDDDDDADEGTSLRRGRSRDRGGLDFHSDFLDDEPQSAHPTIYKDEPDQSDHLQEANAVREVEASPGSGNGNGSREHASQTR